MADRGQSCPGAETMALFLEGGLDDAGERHVRSHVAACAECRALLADAARDEEPEPTILGGKYVLERQIARGGMGRVFLARHTALGRNVAIKTIHPELVDDPAVVRRFEREARAVAVLESRHVVKILDIDWLSTGEPFIVMEHLEGTDLGELVRRNGPLPIADAVRYVLEACDAIAEAHAKGIVHRDLKPQNLFLVDEPHGGPFVKVLDFGLAKALAGGAIDGSSLTVTRALLGSPRFMSPEQMRGDKDIDARTDIWSIGATLFHLVTGVSAFEGSDIMTIRSRVLAAEASSMAAHRPEAPPELEAIVRRCLQREPGDRFQDVDTFARALRDFATTLDTAARAPQRSPEVAVAARRTRRHVISAVLLGAACLAAIVMVGAALLASKDAPSDAPAAPAGELGPPEGQGPGTEAPLEDDDRPPDEISDPPVPTSSGRPPLVRAPRRPRPPGATKKCRPPYTVDSIGRRIYNRDCF